MDPRRVLTFRAVAHQRSFSRAARELALSQPSVSNQVACAGARDRRPAARPRARRPEAHPRGRDPARTRRRHRRALPARQANSSPSPQKVSARGCASAPSRPRSPGSSRPPSHAYASSHPDTKVTVDEGTDDLPARVRSGELHLAVAFQDSARPRQEPPGIERRDLLREQFMVALAPDHPLAERPEVRLADLSEDDWTAALPDGLIVGACRAAGFEPNLVSITHDQLAIRALIARGLAVTLAPQLLADAFNDLVAPTHRRHRPHTRRLRPAATRRPTPARPAHPRRTRQHRRGAAGTYRAVAAVVLADWRSGAPRSCGQSRQRG